MKIRALYGWTKRMRKGHIDHRLYYTVENGFQFIRILTTQRARRIVHLKKKVLVSMNGRVSVPCTPTQIIATISCGELVSIAFAS